MDFHKYARIKAFANLFAFLALVTLTNFSFRRSLFDVEGAVNAPEEGSVMYVGIGALILFFYWFLDLSILIGAIFSLISAILLFPRGGSFRKKRVALILGRIGKFFATASFTLLFLTATTLLSKICYAIFFQIFLSAAILDIIFTGKAKKSYLANNQS